MPLAFSSDGGVTARRREGSLRKTLAHFPRETRSAHSNTIQQTHITHICVCTFPSECFLSGSVCKPARAPRAARAHARGFLLCVCVCAGMCVCVCARARAPDTRESRTVGLAPHHSRRRSVGLCRSPPVRVVLAYTYTTPCAFARFVSLCASVDSNGSVSRLGVSE